MKVGVIHYNFPQFTFEQFLDYCPRAGIEFVELQIADVWGKDVNEPEREAEKVRRQLDARGLRVAALSAGNDFVLLDEAQIERQVERMKRVAQLAKLLGTSIIRTEGGQPKDSVPEERWVEAMAGCFRRLIGFADREDVYFAVDNHGYCTNDGDRQLALIQAVDSRRLGVNLDTMNYRWFGHDIATIDRYYEILAPHTLHTHLKDGRGSRQDYQGAALGDGEIHLAHAVRCLKAAGYDGVWTAEYEGPPPTDAGYRRCADWIRANV
ncbi:MAG: sugar phosphate isomerase/epimerase [Chthonomonadales bacterium]|nr:sugar phosphate isomerase/epimerase [Chthonomonadales bacterium]